MSWLPTDPFGRLHFTLVPATRCGGTRSWLWKMYRSIFAELKLISSARRGLASTEPVWMSAIVVLFISKLDNLPGIMES